MSAQTGTLFSLCLHAFGSLTVTASVIRFVMEEHIFSNFIENKKVEWENYRTQVNVYEIVRYLPMI